MSSVIDSPGERESVSGRMTVSVPPKETALMWVGWDVTSMEVSGKNWIACTEADDLEVGVASVVDDSIIELESVG